MGEHATFISTISQSSARNQATGRCAYVAKRAVERLLTTWRDSDGDGTLKPLTEPKSRSFNPVKSLGNKDHERLNWFRTASRREAYEWGCRSGSRYLYICEDGLVHWVLAAAPLPRHSAGRLHDGRFSSVNTNRIGARSRSSSVISRILDNWRAPDDARSRSAVNKNKRNAWVSADGLNEASSAI